MKLRCLFIQRNKQSGPELLVAWDEYTISENYEGWEKECEEALAPIRKEQTITCAYVDVLVNDEELANRLHLPPIPGKIV